MQRSLSIRVLGKVFSWFAICVVPVYAGTASFITGDVPQGTTTTFSDTNSGVTATFSSSADPGGFVTYSTTDYFSWVPEMLYDHQQAGIGLNIGFSSILNSITMNFGTDGVGPFYLSAYLGTTLVGSTNVTGTAIGSYLQGTITFNGADFNNVVLTSPATPFFAIGNVSVATVAVPACSALSSSTQLSFGDGGGTGTVSFANSPCSWSVSSSQPWVTLPVASGSGSSFSFTVAANPPPGTTRTAMLTINSGALTVAITQSGLVCTYTITDAAAGFGVSRSFASSGGSGGINIVAPAGCAWTATPSQSFITISGSASGSGNGSVSYAVAANTSSILKPAPSPSRAWTTLITEQPARFTTELLFRQFGDPAPHPSGRLRGEGRRCGLHLRGASARRRSDGRHPDRASMPASPISF